MNRLQYEYKYACETNLFLAKYFLQDNMDILDPKPFIYYSILNNNIFLIHWLLDNSIHNKRLHMKIKNYILKISIYMNR